LQQLHTLPTKGHECHLVARTCGLFDQPGGIGLGPGELAPPQHRTGDVERDQVQVRLVLWGRPPAQVLTRQALVASGGKGGWPGDARGRLAGV
jgi:hypothetical protein